MIHRTCKIRGCGAKLIARGWCHKHYKRWQTHGTPNFTKFFMPPRGAINKFLAGIPVSGTGCITWPFMKNNKGYACLNVKSGSRLVSRLLCKKRNGAPPTTRHQAAHSCGNGHLACVAPWHLSWKTRKENMADTKIHGTHRFGEQAPGGAKLTTPDVRQIRKLLRREISQQVIGTMFGVSQGAISRIKRGLLWAHIS